MEVTLKLFWLIVSVLVAVIIAWIVGANAGMNWERTRNRKHVGSLVIAPKDEDGGPYLYFRIEKPFDVWDNDGEEVVLTIRVVTKEELEKRYHSRK